MSHQSRGFTRINNDVTVGGADGSMDNWAKKGNVPGAPSPILDSASVDGRFKVDARPQYDKIAESIRPAPAIDPMAPAPRFGDERTAGNSTSDSDGGASGSAAVPVK